MKPRSIRLKKEYITSVSETKPVKLELFDGTMMLGTGISHIDHPKFTELRDKLEREGYIKTQRSWWNGDSVLKKFILNGMPFKVGDKFPCASALGIWLTVRRKHKK